MLTRCTLRAAIGLALLPPGFPALAGEAAHGIHEIPDAELNLMRGRYTVGGDTVAWFGVSMISSWQTASGQLLQSTLTLGMDFSQGRATPRVSFTPTVSITASDAPLPQAAGGTRSTAAAGLANVAGLVQSVQVAGDGNRAGNVAHLEVREGQAPASVAATATEGASTVQQGDALASAGYRAGGAEVLLQIAGQGQVQQWIRNGSVGQSIQLTADAQQVDNRLQIELVWQSLAGNVPLAQNVAQAITLARGIGR